MATVAELMVRVGADVNNFSRGMQQTQNDLSSTASRFGKIGKSMSSAGKALTLGVTLPIVGLGVAATKMSIDFNKSMANIATLIPGNTKRVNELADTVQKMAVTTGKSTDDLAGGLYQVISAFGDASDTAKILETNAKAAAAGMATTTDSINLTSAVTKGYGDASAESVSKVSDLAFQTVKLGQTTFPELASSMGKVTPLAAGLGVSMEEMFGVMATGTGVTGTASEVSTQLRGVLQSLMSPTKDMSGLLDKLGYSSGDAMIKEIGLQGTINKVIESAKAAGVPLQNYIGSIEGQTLAMALAGPQADVFSQKLLAMEDSIGATNQAFKEQTEGVNSAGFQMEQFKQKITVVAQNLGKALLPSLMQIMDKAIIPLIGWIEKVVTWFANLNSGTQKIILGFIAFLVILGPILSFLGTLFSVVSSLITIWSALAPVIAAAGGIMAIITGPIGWIIAAIVGLIAIAIILWKNWDVLKAKTLEIWGSIVKFFTVTIPSKMESFVQWFRSLPKKISTFLAKLPERAGFFLGTLVRISYEKGSAAVNALVNWFKSLPSKISTALRNTFNSAKTWFNNMVSGAKTAGSNLVLGFKTVINGLPGVLSTVFKRMLGIIKSWPGELKSKATSIAQNFWSGFKKGLGISSPSYIEKAFSAMVISSKDALKGLKSQAPKFASIASKISAPIPISGGNIKLASAGANNVGMGFVNNTSMDQNSEAGAGISINISNLNVRNEADIEKISQKLYRLMQSRARSKGVRA